MAKIKIRIGEEEKEVTLRAFENHQIKFIEGQSKFQKEYEEKGEDQELIKNFMKFKNDLLLECLNITEEDFKKIDLEDKNKLRKELQIQLFPEVGKDKIFF